MPVVRLTCQEKKLMQELRAKGATAEEIAARLGRSLAIVARHLSMLEESPASEVAPPPPPALIPLTDLDLTKTPRDVFDRAKLQVAVRSLNAAATLVQDIESMTPAQRRSVPLSQKAIAAGILIDKFRQLTEPDPAQVVNQIATLVSLIGKATPPRAKDALPEDAQVVPDFPIEADEDPEDD